LRKENPASSGFLRFDKYYPVRSANIFQRSMEERLGPHMREKEGLANLVLALTTGQGEGTMGYFKSHFMFSRDAGTHLKSFTTFWERERHRVEQDGSKKTKALCIDDPVCFGTCCGHLAFKRNVSTDRPCFEDKIDPIFRPAIFDLWTTFLSKTSTFQDALALGPASGIIGLGSNSLTGMQLANTLSLMGFCSAPTYSDMATLIYSGKRGSLEGLQRVGFNACSVNAVERSLTILYRVLDHHLSQDHKAAIGFGLVFLEHLLCKISRWEKLFKSHPSLDSTGMNLREQWLAGKLDLDEQRLPVPVHVACPELVSNASSGPLHYRNTVRE
jgi:hypothetical protein